MGALRARIGAAIAVAIVSHAPRDAGAQPVERGRSGPSLKRIAKTFDFDERRLGNFESLPMNWLPIVGDGYPRFLEPAFDMDHGHDAAPSFHMGIRTGSVGAHFLAKDIPAHPDSEYRISAWVRTEGLTHSGAVVSAYYLDHALRRIDGTERECAAVNSSCCGDGWSRVFVDLPGGVEAARWIGLSCRIRQPAPPDSAGAPFAAIPRRDAVGGAWFDDIVVIRRPRMRMRLNDATHVYFEGEPMAASVSLLDLDGAGLDLSLEVTDAAGSIRQATRLSGPDLLTDAPPVAIVPLPPGLYTVRLDMRLDEDQIASRERRFAVLRRIESGTQRPSEGFGVNLNVADLDRGGDLEIVRKIKPGAVKAPLLRSGLTDEAAVFGEPGVRALLASLRAAGIDVVGVLDSIPGQSAAASADRERPIHSAIARPLADRPDWVAYLRLLLTRHGGWTSAWQLGSDADAAAADVDSIARAVKNLRTIVNPLVGHPRIIVPIWAIEPAGQFPGDIVARSFAFHMTPERRTSSSVPTAGAEDSHWVPTEWATVAMGDEARYARIPRLARFARGLVAARAAGFDAVFTPPLWDEQPTDEGPAIRPREELVLFEAAARRLGGLASATRLTLNPDVETWLFEALSSTRGVVVAWSDSSGEASLTLDIDGATKIDDAWGRPVAVTVSPRGVQVPVGELPIYLLDVDVRRIRALDSFELDDDAVAASIRAETRLLRFRNTTGDEMVGALRIEAPAGWRVSPRQFELRLESGETLDAPIDIKPRGNSPAGRYELIGQVEAGGGTLQVSCPLSVLAPGLDVNVLARREGDSIRFLQRVTNTADHVMRLRSYLIAPGRPRETQTIPSLAAGETVVREFVVGPATSLAGQYVRVTVEQIDGELRHNTVIKMVGDPSD